MTDQSIEELAATVLTAETVKRLRDTGPKDLLWLICDSHELLRAHCEQLQQERDEARHIAKNLFPMIDRKTWRSIGVEIEGHYEGDYYAEQIRLEIEGWKCVSEVRE